MVHHICLLPCTRYRLSDFTGFVHSVEDASYQQAHISDTGLLFPGFDCRRSVLMHPTVAGTRCLHWFWADPCFVLHQVWLRHLFLTCGGLIVVFCDIHWSSILCSLYWLVCLSYSLLLSPVQPWVPIYLCSLAYHMIFHRWFIFGFIYSIYLWLLLFWLSFDILYWSRSCDHFTLPLQVKPHRLPPHTHQHPLVFLFQW